MASALLFAFGLFITFPSHGETSGLRGAPGQISRGDVESSLISELVGIVANDRPVQLEAALRPTYNSLPKNAYGNLDHQAVRYVLHRMFVQRHGWFIKGLEPDGTTSGSASSQPFLSEEWVPSYLQSLLEQRLGARGMNLKELAALAAALETLVHKEVAEKVKASYDALGFSTAGKLREEHVQSVINIYMMNFLEPRNETSAMPVSLDALLSRLQDFTSTYFGWPEVEEWLRKIETRQLGSSNERGVDFGATQRIVEEIGEEFYHFNDIECRDLKATLLQMEDQQPGRVRLSDFYKKSLYSHWQFSEKIDYLRQLGALDESDPSQPLVILPNYLGARPNCLEASSIYAVCCRNECEDLMAHLERELAAPVGKADHIATLVAALPSDTIQAPRNLSERLLGRLKEVAASNGGQVPLHGRLFAQWMHHAFPRECPHPHAAGTSNPQTPDEWMKSTGQESATHSETELLRHIESEELRISSSGITQPQKQNHIPGEDDQQEQELPWSEGEELLVCRPEPPAPSVTTGSRTPLVVLAFVIALGMLALWLMARKRRGEDAEERVDAAPLKPRLDLSGGIDWTPLAFCVLSIAVLLFGLMDTTVFAGALLGGCALLSLRRVLPQGPTGVKKCP